MPDLKSKLSEHKMLIVDGAWGTQLASLGMEPGYTPEKMNLEQPDIVRRVALHPWAHTDLHHTGLAACREFDWAIQHVNGVAVLHGKADRACADYRRHVAARTTQFQHVHTCAGGQDAGKG